MSKRSMEIPRSGGNSALLCEQPDPCIPGWKALVLCSYSRQVHNDVQIQKVDAEVCKFSSTRSTSSVETILMTKMLY